MDDVSSADRDGVWIHFANSEVVPSDVMFEVDSKLLGRDEHQCGVLLHDSSVVCVVSVWAVHSELQHREHSDLLRDVYLHERFVCLLQDADGVHDDGERVS